MSLFDTISEDIKKAMLAREKDKLKPSGPSKPHCCLPGQNRASECHE
jgi:hypothetical protein